VYPHINPHIDPLINCRRSKLSTKNVDSLNGCRCTSQAQRQPPPSQAKIIVSSSTSRRESSRSKASTASYKSKPTTTRTSQATASFEQAVVQAIDSLLQAVDIDPRDGEAQEAKVLQNNNNNSYKVVS
jgi:hypothetical protein